MFYLEFSSFLSSIVDLFVRISWIRVHWSWKLFLSVSIIVCGPYPNQTYGFSSPTYLWEVVSRLLVGCLELIVSIDCFTWSKITLEYFSLAFFCSYFTCVYWVYYISVIWLKKLFPLCVRKFSVGRIQTRHTDLLPPQVFGKSWLGCQFCDFTCNHKFIDWLQVNNPKFFKMFVDSINISIETRIIYQRLVVKVGRISWVM